MPKILITGKKLKKAKNGMTAGEPCPQGQIKVDGECIDEKTRNFTVYETGVEGEYSKTFNPKYPGAWTPSGSASTPVVEGKTLPEVKVYSSLNNTTNPFDDESFITPNINQGLDYMGGDPSVKLRNYIEHRRSVDDETTRYIKLYFDAVQGKGDNSSVGQMMAQRYLNGGLSKKNVDDIVEQAKDFEESIRFHKDYDPNQSIAQQRDLINTYSSDDEARRRIYRDWQQHRDHASDMGLGNTGLLGEGINLVFNALSDVTLSPASGAALVLHGINPNAYTKSRGAWNAFSDVTGISNYPNFWKAVDEFKQNPGVLTGLGVGAEFAGSIPLVGEFEKIGSKAVLETPKITKSLFSPLYKTPWSKASSAERAAQVIKFPVKLTGRTINNPVVHTLNDYAGTPAYIYDKALATITGKTLPKSATLGQAVRTSNLFTQNDLEDPISTVIEPIAQGVQVGGNWLQGIFGNQPNNNIKVPYSAPSIDQNAPNIYFQNPTSKDTLINLRTPDGTIYQTTTEHPDYKLIESSLKLSNDIWNPSTKTFDIDSNFVTPKGTYPTKQILNNLFTPIKQEYGGSFREIPNLFMHSPEKNLPGRMRWGGIPRLAGGGTPPNCDPGYMVDPNDASKCIEDPNYVPIVSLTPTQSMVENAAFQTDPRPETDTHPLFDMDGNPLVNGKPFESKDIPTVDLNERRNRRRWARTLNKPYDIDPLDKPCPPEKYNPLTGKCFDSDTNSTVKNQMDRSYPLYGKGMTRLSRTLGRVANVANYFHNREKRKTARKQFDINKYSQEVVAGRDPGSMEQINTGNVYDRYGRRGYQFQNQASGYGQTEFGGSIGGSLLKDTNMSNTVKIKILGGPTEEMAYGGQSGYGFDLGQRNTYAAMPKGKTQTVSNTIQEVPRDQANIEAEKGETVYGDIDGDGVDEHMNIEGKRHVDGGTPLNVPEGSFVFSDTKKMRIKDPEMLAKFGLSPRKEGYTPAEIAKRYDINKYKAVIQDPNSDQLMKNTALLMIKNYQKKLAELALLQESMKGFPQGVPEMCKGVLPDELIEQIESKLQEERGQAAPGQRPGPGPDSPMAATEEEDAMQPSPEQAMMAPQEDMQEGMMYGGSYAYGGGFDDLEDYDYEAPPKYPLGGGTPPDWNKDYTELEKMLTAPEFQDLRDALYAKYKAGRGASDPITQDEYIKNLLETQRQKYKINEAYQLNPTYLHSPDWDRGGRNTMYRKVATDLGLPIQTDDDIKRGQQAYLDFVDLVKVDPTFSSKYKDRFDVTPIGVADEPDYRGMKNVTPADYWRGNTDIGQLIRLGVTSTPGDTSVFGYICTGRDANNIPQVGPAVSYPNEAARTAAGAFASRDEAIQKGCPPGTTTTVPGKKWICAKNAKGTRYAKESTTGYDSPEEALKHCSTDVPFDYMTPDLWAIDSANAARVNWYGPFVQDVDYEASNYTPEEWRAKAAELQSQTNDAARALAAYGPATGFSANLSNVQGKQARNLIGAVADVDARNVQGLNAFKRGEIARKDQFKALRAANQGERWKGTTVANQQYDTALNAKDANVTAARINAWNNRMKLGMENETNKYYLTSPYTGQLIWKSGYGVEDLGNGVGGSKIPTYTEYKDKIDPTGTPETYKIWINANYGKTAKYGGPIQKKYPTFTDSEIADMLSNGYGFPF